jgi:hypothetical protein
MAPLAGIQRLRQRLPSAVPGWLRLSLAHLTFLAASCAYIGHYFPEQSRIAWVFRSPAPSASWSHGGGGC